MNTLRKRVLAETIAFHLHEGDKKGRWLRGFFRAQDYEPEETDEERSEARARRHEELLKKKRQKEGRSFGLDQKTGKKIVPK